MLQISEISGTVVHIGNVKSPSNDARQQKGPQVFGNRKKVDALWKMAGIQAWQSVPEDVMLGHAEQTGTLPTPILGSDGTPHRLVRALKQSPTTQTVGHLVRRSVAGLEASQRISGMERGLARMQIAMFLGIAYGELIDRSGMDAAMQAGRDALFAHSE